MAEKRFIKGLFKDTGHIDQPEGSWRHAHNMIINEKEGSVSNEGGTELAGHLGVDRTQGNQDQIVIGAIEVSDDRTVLFVTDAVLAVNPRSEIGMWEKGVYTTIFNPEILAPNGKLTNDLNFRVSNPINGTFKIDSKGDLIVYWTDDLNPPRAFNVDRQLRESAVVEDLYGITSINIDNIDILNLFPYSGPVPHISVDDQGTHQNCIVEGGGLRTGVYYLALAYVDDDFVATNYLTVSNPISIVDEFDHTTPTNKKDGARHGNQTTKAIKWEISNLNTNYKYLRPVIIRSMGDAREAFKLNDYTFNSSSTSLTYSGLETQATGSPTEVIVDTIAYDTCKTIQQLDNVLYVGNTTGSKDLGYQRYANNIKLRSKIKEIPDFDEFYAAVDNIQTGWGSVPVNQFGGSVQDVDETKSYRYVPNIFKFKGYMRDEVYAFYIAFIMKDGSMSYAYHIPGRDALGNERSEVSSMAGNTYGGLWNDIQDVSPGYGRRFHWIDSVVDSISGGSYNINTYMGMNFWENATEFYPDTDNYEIWDETGYTTNDLKGLQIRHHHFPSNRHPDRKSIDGDHQCRTDVSGGTVPPIRAWTGIITKEYGTCSGSGSCDVGLQSTYTRTPWNSGTNNIHVPDNNVAMYNALWNQSSYSFFADQQMQVRVRFECWYTECGSAQTVKTRARHRYSSAAPTQTVLYDQITSLGGAGCGGCQDANSSLNDPGALAQGWSSWRNVAQGDEIYVEHECDANTNGDCAHYEGNIDDVCGGNYPGSLNSTSTINNNSYRHLSFLQIEVRPATPQPDPKDLRDAKLSHNVRILGFDLEDIKIPQSIADKVQGFRVYYAKRNHADRTVLGQSILLPGMKYQERLGICQEALTNAQAAMQVLNTLQDLPEPFYSMDAWPRDWQDYEELPFYLETGATINPVGPINNAEAHNIFSFYDFYLLRTKNSLAPATHIDLLYRVQNLVWNGPGIDQDKKMLTLYEPGATPSDPDTVKEVWGWDDPTDVQNCYPQNIRSGIYMGCNYETFHFRTQPRLLGQKAKTYLLGDTIFKGEALGFGGKLFNEFGQSQIAFKVKDDHAISSELLMNKPFDQSIGIYQGSANPEFGEVGRSHVGAAILTTGLDANGNFENNAEEKSTFAIANLKAFKTDVYKSIDNQELVWTGFEVLGDELDNFIFDDTGMLGTGNTADLAGMGGVNDDYEGIFGGDTFLCRHGVIQSLKPSNAASTSNPEKGLHFHIVESTDNINFRHQEDDDSMYFPGTIAKTLLTDAGLKDFNHVDNKRYNDNYSENNDIRPAFPLPVRDVLQDDFPTRTHRSAKHDPTSLIDNYRIFLANQYKDLPKNRGELWKLSSFSNLLYFHMEESLFAAQGKQTMSMKDGSEAFVGSGDIFAQEPNEMVQTEGGFGGTQSMYAALTTRYGYFFVDRNSRKVFMMKDQLLEISSLGMEEWFKENLKFELEDSGLTSLCGVDNPIFGFGFHAVYDPQFKRIMLTKREFTPTVLLTNGLNMTTGNYVGGNFLNAIRFNKDRCIFQIWQEPDCQNPVCPPEWFDLPFSCSSKYFNCSGWTISYYPELGYWGSFHSYVPYLYFNTATDFYSFTDQYNRPVWVPNTPATQHAGTTFGNAGIWRHNSNANHGILYQDWLDIPVNITFEEWLGTITHHPFELEFIHNEYKAADTLVTSINYTLETFNQENISVLEHGFTSYFVYNTFQISGENLIEYLINTRRVGNNWKINNFRDMAAAALDTSGYYTAAGVNIIGGTNQGTVTTSSVNNMFIYDGMFKTINPLFLDLTKNWNLQRKFIDKWVGIRLIYNNISNNSVNLYATDIGVRKTYR